ncbi:AsmA family protein [Myxococcaceae bacterium JPH2]|nr:AsmA family protein [Myxococcaceae bacterium JPH2]
MKVKFAPHRGWKVSLGFVLAVLVLVVGAVVLKPSWIAGRLRGQVEAIATKSFGRPVTIDKLEAHWLPRPGATMTNLRVEGEGNEPPFLEAARASVSVRVWPLLRSLGKDLSVGRVELDGAKLNLVRRKDGRWNYESLGRSGTQSEQAPVVERIRLRNGVVNVTDQQAARGTAAVALRAIDADLKNLGPGMTPEGTMKAALAAPKQNVELDFKVESLGAGERQPGSSWPTLTMHLRGKGLSVPAFRNFLPPKATRYFTGGLVDVTADVKTEGGAYSLAGHGAATALRLRGDPASGSFAFHSHIVPANAKATTVNFTQIALKGPGLELSGTASVHWMPPRVQFALQGRELDLKHLLGALPPQPATEESSPALPASVRAQLGKVDVGGTLRLAKLSHGTLMATDVDAEAKLDEGVLFIQRGRATLYGGQADISGTRVDLTKEQPAWSLHAVLTGLDTEQAFQALAGNPVLQGKASGKLQLNGTGADWAEVRNTLNGSGDVQLHDGVLTTADLGSAVAPVLVQGQSAPEHPGTKEAAPKAGHGTRLKDLSAQFRVQDGWVAFTQPMAFQSDFGDGTLDGRVGLDERLELKGTIKASKQFVSAMTHGVIPVGSPVTIPLTITGSLSSPVVKPGNANGIAPDLLPKVPLLKSIENPVNQARKGIGDIFKKRPRK